MIVSLYSYVEGTTVFVWLEKSLGQRFVGLIEMLVLQRIGQQAPVVLLILVMN